MASEQCTARAKSTQKQCTRPAIPGGNVCRYHGGAAPQVRAKALERLAAQVSPAVAQLGRLIKSKHPPTSLGAVKHVLDLNGISPKKEEEGGHHITINFPDRPPWAPPQS